MQSKTSYKAAPEFLTGTDSAALDCTDSSGAPARSRMRLLDSHMFVAFLFCAILVCAFLPCLLHQRVLAPLDIVQAFYEPWTRFSADSKMGGPHNHFATDAVDRYLGWQHIAAVSFKEDGYVGWNPLTFGGRPEYANTMGLYFDWTMQLHRLLGFWDAWDLGLLFQFAIAGIGMLFFLRSQSLSPSACLAGAIAYAGNSQFVVWIYCRYALGSFCWVPWLLWELERTRRGSKMSALGLSVITALAFLGGSLQYDSFILLVILCVVLSWQFGPARPRKVAIKEGGLILASTGLALVLSALMLVPCTQGFFDNAAVGHNRAVLTYKEGMLEPVLHPVIVICSAFPTALGSVRTLDLTKLFKGDYTEILYFGFLPVVIAFYCLMRKTTPLAARLLMLFGLVLPETPAEGLLYHRVSLLFIVGGVWAFADYWDKVDPESARSFAKRALLVFLIISILWTICSVFVTAKHVVIVDLLKRQVASRLSDAQFGMFKQWIMDRTAKWVTDFPIWSAKQLLPWILAGASLLLLRLRYKFPKHYATYALTAVLTPQVLIFAADWVTLSPRPLGTVLPANAEIERVKQLVGKERVYLVPAEGKPPLLPPNTLSTYDIATLQDSESIWPRTMWYKAGYAVTPEVLSRQAVRFAIVQKGAATERDCWYPHATSDIRSPSGGWDLRLLIARISVYSAYTQDHTRPDSLAAKIARDAGVSACWPLIYSGTSFDVFRNDQAVPRYLAITNSRAVPAQVISETFNYRRLRLPLGTESVRVSENWAQGWRYRTDDSDWYPAVQSSDMSIIIPHIRSDRTGIVELKFKPSDWGRQISIWAWVSVIIALTVGTLGRFASFLRRIPPRTHP